MPRESLIKMRQGTTSQWNNADAASVSDPERLLAAGEMGRDSTTNVLKVGDGVTKFADLPAFIDENEVNNAIADFWTPVDNGDGTITIPSGMYADNGDGTITLGA